MRRSPFDLVLLVSTFAAACYLPGDDTGMSHGIGVENRSAENVDIVYAAPGGEKHVLVSDLLALAGTALISPGSKIGDCNEGPLRAYNDAGELVAETTERLCDGDRWIIPAGASPS